MKATMVEDIRMAHSIPGAVEFHAGRRMIFWTCPCGCGAVGQIDFLKSFATRKPVSIYRMDFTQDGKPTMGDPLLIGYINGDDPHWVGTLINGEWNELVNQRTEAAYQSLDKTRIYVEDREAPGSVEGFSIGDGEPT
jgi:hypothetical protein